MAASGLSASSSSSSSGKISKLPHVALSTQLLSTFKPARVFNQYVQKDTAVTSLSFDDRGSLCITGGEDETIHLYDCRTGRHTQTLYSKKYGVHLTRFTHSSSSIIYGSTKENDTIRYHSIHDNTFLRYFTGHKSKVVSLEMSPINDTFLSGAVDDSVRLWDLRSPNFQGRLNVRGHPVVAYDPAGLVFAVAINERSAILLYDMRQFDKDPFMTIHLDDAAALSMITMPPRVPVITSLQFNNQGQHLLVGTAGDVHYVVDSFNGRLLRRLVGHQGLERASGHQIGMVPEAGISGQEVGWTPDGKFVVSGSETGQIFVWPIPEHPPAPTESLDLQPATVISGHEGPSRVVGFNPVVAQFVSAGSSVAMWLPEELAEEQI